VEKKNNKVRVLFGKLGLDCHDTGITTIARMLMEEGFEVIYGGLHNTAQGLYDIACQEAIDVIGVSFLSGEHMYHMRKLMDLIKEDDNLLVLVGGVIPKADISKLLKIGVGKVFTPGTMSDEVFTFIRENR